MDTDVRDSITVWLVFRRESRGVGKRGIYHYMGCAIATGNISAKEMAFSMCMDETYFTFSSPVNVALPEGPVFPRDLVFPCKGNKSLLHEIENDMINEDLHDH